MNFHFGSLKRAADMRSLTGRIRDIFKQAYCRDGMCGSGREFTYQYLSSVKDGDFFLDAGCGSAQIKNLLPKDTVYIGIDIHSGKNAAGYSGWNHKPTIIADLNHLPLIGSSFDTVVRFYVLEHDYHPRAILSEIYRVLKPRGHLFLTVPFVYRIHHKPFDYLRYTDNGIRSLIADAGLSVLSIKLNGGYFRVLRLIFREFFQIIRQKSIILNMLLLPLILLVSLLHLCITVFEYPLDLLDTSHNFTTGYMIIATK